MTRALNSQLFRLQSGAECRDRLDLTELWHMNEVKHKQKKG